MDGSTGAELGGVREEFEVLPPAELLEGLAVNMRAYDELVVKRKAMMAALDAFGEFDGLELEDVPNQPTELAYKALAFVVSKHKLASVEAEIGGLKGSAFYAELGLRLGGLYTKRYEITALDPDKEKIGAFYTTDYNYELLNYAGRSYLSRKGRVQKLDLSPITGGFINLRSQGGIIYQAGPLIDRDNDYQPLFDIKDISK